MQDGADWTRQRMISSLLAGLRIADQGDYYDLLASSRPTLVSRFAAAGYRCGALMPGLGHAWPEGEFHQTRQEVFIQSLHRPPDDPLHAEARHGEKPQVGQFILFAQRRAVAPRLVCRLL